MAGLVPAIHVFLVPKPYGATNSTRRFSARPLSLSFEPTGDRKPTPAVRRRACAILKFFTSSAATASARRRDRSRL